MKVRMFESYKEVADFWGKGARNPSLGKPVISGFRLYKLEDGSFEFAHMYIYKEKVYGKVAVCRVTSDNLLTFLPDRAQMRTIQHSISQQLHKLFPMFWRRDGIGRWSIIMRPFTSPQKHWWAYLKDKSTPAYTYDAGMQINLSTHSVVNGNDYRYTDKNIIDTEARKEWLSKMRAAKARLKAYIRLAGDSVPIQVKFYRQYTGEDVANMLYTLVFHPDTADMAALTSVVKRLAYQNAYWTERENITHKLLCNTVDKVFKHNSDALRLKAGVIVGKEKVSI